MLALATQDAALQRVIVGNTTVGCGHAGCHAPKVMLGVLAVGFGNARRHTPTQ